MDLKRSMLVRLARSDGIELSIEDDGRQEATRPAQPGMGVLGMHERVQALGGSFTLTPRKPHGMIVQVSIPLATQASTRQ